ncbi:hypothetical protein GCM10007170_17340 [Arthrobacter liuii]|uniref:Glucose/Sorbosone dehydrogenase domain-containing protein n=1 Tax=Arthrobacter liuii TaxID=1476996 RepID=A0ABQ2ANF7_9MICC|nr:hypothetical protein GCM10007170_17340 [Arthrobacter liuii]
MWTSEFGPDVDDELNLILPGGNYGWPLVTERRTARSSRTQKSYGPPRATPRPADWRFSAVLPIWAHSAANGYGRYPCTEVTRVRLWPISQESTVASGTWSEPRAEDYGC